MRWLSAFGLVMMVLLGTLLFPGPALADAQGANVGEQRNFTEAQFVITVYENGSARFTQRYIQPLSNDTEVSHFRSYAEKFESTELPVYTDFKERAISLVEEGSNVTGREMYARGFTREARVVPQPTPTGVIEMSFLWTNFTAAENGRIVVGGVFENGLYLSSEMSLTIKAGPHLDVVWRSVKPTPDASTNESGNTTDSFTYFGEQQFASGHPRVTFVSESAVVVGGSPVGTPLLLVGGVFALALVLGAVVVRRSDTVLFGDEKTTAPTAKDTADDSTTETNEAVTPPEPAVSDADLRTDEDRVTALLEANGGRMQQGKIVEETGWSKSKVSTLLSEMENEERVSKLRIGRENIVSLEGHEPEATHSPFEDR